MLLGIYLIGKEEMTMLSRTIYVTFQQEFIHRYPDAPDEVAYLRDFHRHVAHIRVDIEVYHNERELEFIMVKHAISQYVSELVRTVKDNSCESIAENIIEFVKKTYGDNRDIIVEVSEDGENGCVLMYTKEI